MAQVQICSGYSGESPVVANFFFNTAGFEGILKHSYKVFLATRGPAVVGGILLHGTEVLCLYAETRRIRSMLSREARSKK